ncbi:NUDIX hydrolase [Chryseobacterium sp. 6424]|uniref:NUDIX hydrolase n=1 Tax=Chryseobacterium sp. 6424 TaxID=2039166 RepID=UPI000EFAFE85|nr:NUDIX domain-containing protein [Chryseobacterium sp. 6424]AYO56800.1 NUDIX hydrolase [Chryseobacterium sp. 6424]
MNNLTYCAKCGRQSLLWDGVSKWSCRNCDYVLYHNVAGAVAVIISCGDEILLTRRNQEPKKGKLDLPGGFTDPKESAEETCSREIQEELRIKIRPEKFKYLKSLPNIYEYKDIVYNTLDLFFSTEIAEKAALTLEESEITEVLWLKPEDLSIKELAFESQQTFFQEYLQNRRKTRQ